MKRLVPPPPSLPSVPPGSRKDHRSAFTILELLIVVGIISLMAVLAVPAFNQIGKAQALSNAGNQITDLLAAARQNSMTKNCLTVVVIAAGNNQWDSCILYELRPRVDGGAPQQADWKVASKWETLPVGITVDDTNFVDQAKASDQSLPAPLPIIRRGSAVVSQFRFITFMPRGTLYPKTLPASSGANAISENPYVRVANAQRAGQKVVYTKLGANGLPTDLYKVIVLTATGITKIERS